MLKAILFDVDGTLAETEEFHRCAFNAAFAQAGLAVQWSADEYRGLLKVTGGKERLAAYFRDRNVDIDLARIRALHASKNALYARGVAAGGGPLRPGVARLMREARAAGVRLGIATTTSAENLAALLQPLLGAQWELDFACIVAGDQVAHKKPAPDVYRACLVRLEMAADEVLAIEDSAAGVRSARDAGIRVLVTPSVYTDHHDFAGADHVLPHLGDPEIPWDGARAGFAQRYVQLEDLRKWYGGARAPARAGQPAVPSSAH